MNLTNLLKVLPISFENLHGTFDFIIVYDTGSVNQVVF